jgi:hypothetical protein
MEFTFSKERSDVQNYLIIGGCALIALVGLIIPRSQPPAKAALAEPIPERAPVGTKPVSAWSTGAEPRVTFAPVMPRAHGSQVFNNNGTPNPGMIMVAIPDGPKSVRYVRGTDPAAVKYLAAVTEEQKRVVQDRGPANIGTGEIGDLGPLKGRTKRRVQNLASDN